MSLFLLFTAIYISFSQHDMILADKIEGVNFIGPYEAILEPYMMEDIKMVHAEWIALIPGAIMSRTTLEISTENNRIGWYESAAGIEKSIQISQNLGFRIMLKPHIVLQYVEDIPTGAIDKTDNTEWRGSYVASDENDWKLLEDNYRNFIIPYAQMAEDYHVELFCIGTELREFVISRPYYWNQLIDEIRKIYTGKICYSANWDGFEKIPLWDKLDYVGLNSYFPLSKKDTPSVKNLNNKWKEVKKSIYTLSQEKNKKIIFTEFGWRNVDASGKEPWIHNAGIHRSNYKVQSNLYSAFFESIWNEPWVAGGFCWDWNYKTVDVSDTNFHINNKPAAKILAKYYQ